MSSARAPQHRFPWTLVTMLALGALLLSAPLYAQIGGSANHGGDGWSIKLNTKGARL